jgi:hypothetical protein
MAGPRLLNALGLSLIGLGFSLGGCDARPTLKIHLYDVPPMVDRLDLTVWLRYPDTSRPGRYVTEELLRPGVSNQSVVPRTQLINSGSTSLGLALSGNVHPSADTTVIVTVLGRQGTRLVGSGTGQSLLTEPNPVIPDILDIKLEDPIAMGSADESKRNDTLAFTSARLACNILAPSESPVLTVQGWGFTPSLHVKFEDEQAGGAAPIESDVEADSGLQLQATIDPAFNQLKMPKLTLTTNERDQTHRPLLEGRVIRCLPEGM